MRTLLRRTAVALTLFLAWAPNGAAGSSAGSAAGTGGKEAEQEAEKKAGQGQPAARAGESPKQVLLRLYQSSERGDAEGVRARIHAAGGREKKMGDAMVALAAAVGKFRKEAEKHFGDGAKEMTIADPLGGDMLRLAIGRATELIERDTARIKLSPDDDRDMAVLKKVGGAW